LLLNQAAVAMLKGANAVCQMIRKTDLRAEKLTFKSPIAVAFVNGDRESEIYMHDFADAFRRSGIEPLFMWTSPDGADQVGVYIAVRDRNTPPPLASNLQVALRAIGINADIIPFPRADISGARDPGPVALYVAPRPL
jgi:hypothetical protein